MIDLIQASLTFAAIVWALIALLIAYIYIKTPFLKDHVKASFDKSAPLISIILPAKDEENNIEACVNSLLKQTYPNFELILINDRSEDRTLEIMKEMQNKDPRIKIVEVKVLPPGWVGKSHAIFQGMKHARGEWFLFTDADTVHEPPCLSAAMGYAKEKELDSLSVEPEFVWNMFLHKLIFPVISLGTACLFPVFVINRKGSKVTLCNGQYILIKKNVYEAVGGHEKIKDRILEDLAIIENVKKAGYTFHLVMGVGLERVKMYTDMQSFWKGWSRILFLGLQKNIVSAVVIFVLSFVISLIPFLILLLMLISPSLFSMLKHIFLLDLFVIFLIFLVNGFMHYIFRINLFYALLHPLSVLAAMGVLGSSVHRALGKKEIEWKGVKYKV